MLDKVVQIAEAASKLILDYYNSNDFEVRLKSDNSPVTDADMTAHNFIVSELEKISTYPILSEEAPQPFSERKAWKNFWLVDPLDGTKDFIKRTDDFTVNIALVSGNVSVLGVVAIPARGVVYYATKGNGAFRKDSSGIKRISVTNEMRSLKCGVSRFHCSDDTLLFCKRNNIVDLVGYGSSLKFCKIADGELDVYPRLAPTMEWDIAAADCILREAGGKIYGEKSKAELLYNKEDLHNESFIACRADLNFI